MIAAYPRPTKAARLSRHAGGECVCAIQHCLAVLLTCHVVPAREQRITHRKMSVDDEDNFTEIYFYCISAAIAFDI